MVNEVLNVYKTLGLERNCKVCRNLYNLLEHCIAEIIGRIYRD